jgi:hypothetical protein
MFDHLPLTIDIFREMMVSGRIERGSYEHRGSRTTRASCAPLGRLGIADSGARDEAPLWPGAAALRGPGGDLGTGPHRDEVGRNGLQLRHPRPTGRTPESGT